ncbi:hypothetical protein EV182_002672 [Spiromyces aspiralis]|uniref:Uncharacterized protein n=1 Tax=Spiromyces aspiralis TaxID=68401 RepID=A0ACC1HDQ7_9FUNG|nr:hypothetical protein EV182_002672 [Spiromyces aspiralis]
MCLDYLKLNNEDIILEGEDSNPEDEDSNPEDEDSNPEDEDSDSEDEDSIEPSASPLTSILVEMTDALPAGPSPQDNKPYFSNNTIKFIKVDIARYNQGSLTEHPTLNKFMTMAYYYGYLTMIEGMYVVIPNREVLKFWAKLIADGTGTPGEPLLLQESKVLADTLTSWDLEGFCEALKVHFLEPLIKADAGAREYYYHEIMFIQLNLGLDPDQYYCVAEFSTARGRTDICILPRVKGRMGFLIEVKRTSKDGVMDSGRSSGSTGSGGTTNSTVDITKAPYCHLDECLKVGIRQVEERGYLRAFAAYCTRVLTIVPAFCGKQYLVCFKNYRYAKSKLGWVPCAKHPSVKHECSRPLPDAMALVKRSTEVSSSKRAKGRGKRGGGS